MINLNLSNFNIWNYKYQFSLILALQILTIFVIHPLKAMGYAEIGSVISYLIIFSLYLGVFTFFENRLIRGISVFVGVLIIIRHEFSSYYTLSENIEFELISSIVSLLILCFIVLKMVLFLKHIGPSQRLIGSIVAYLALGNLFSYIYEYIYVLYPTSFTGNFVSHSALNSYQPGNFLYFSFISLTTIGFGDISPIHPLSRAFVIIEGLLGQLYPAIIIGRLISDFSSETSK